jgi:hypothetical protein
MLDKILGKKDKDKDVPDLRKDGKKSDSDIGGRLKGMVSKATEKSKDKMKSGDDKPSSNKTTPRPMPKPRPKPTEAPRLKPPKKKPPKKPQKPGRFGGLGKVPDDDQRTLVGAAVFGIILIILVGAGYYFLVYAPYQEALNSAKDTKFNEVNTYYKGPLALAPEKSTILAEIEGGTTPEQVLAVDVIGPATTDWRQYQSQQINTKKDPYNRVMITYAAGGQKNLIVKTTDAQTIVNAADATVLSNMEIKTPDTVAVPIIITRLQAAGGLINVGDSVDVYLSTTNTTTTNQTNQTTTTTTTQNATTGAPEVSGSTVLAILRAKDSGIVAANLKQSQDMAVNQLTMTNSRSQSTTTDPTGGLEDLLKAAASRTWDEATVNSLLNSYGWRLSDFERTSNLGDLNVQYLVVLEVPRENALFLMQNSNALQLTLSSQNAPQWLSNVLKKKYG